MSEAEKKAEAIIEMYWDCLWNNTIMVVDEEINNQAKQCALIHVDGIIEQMGVIIDSCYYHDESKWVKIQDEWQEVKTIIENK